jgi:hypothetical protein
VTGSARMRSGAGTAGSTRSISSPARRFDRSPAVGTPPVACLLPHPTSCQSVERRDRQQKTRACCGRRATHTTEAPPRAVSDARWGNYTLVLVASVSCRFPAKPIAAGLQAIATTVLAACQSVAAPPCERDEREGARHVTAGRSTLPRQPRDHAAAIRAACRWNRQCLSPQHGQRTHRQPHPRWNPTGAAKTPAPVRTKDHTGRGTLYLRHPTSEAPRCTAPRSTQLGRRSAVDLEFARVAKHASAQQHDVGARVRLALNVNLWWCHNKVQENN